jgi:hypothetical protein
VSCLQVIAQEPGVVPPEEEDNLPENDGGEDEDDRIIQLHTWRKHPLDLNFATTGELQILGLNPLQIAALALHRKKFGDLIALQELQAVEGWDLHCIRQVLPYVTIGEKSAMQARMKQGLKSGSHLLLLRSALTPEKSKGYLPLPTGRSYQGSGVKMLTRYQYRSPAGIQAGFTAEKDAGETFFKQKRLEFASGHLYFRNAGMLNALVIGDYKIQTGQGLLTWQGNGFRKGAGSLLVKRQGPLLLPYAGAGEYLFSRGIATEWEWKKWKLLIFYSSRKYTASLDVNELRERTISTIIPSGFHRTVLELNKKNNITHRALGVTGRYEFETGHLSINGLQHFFSLYFSKGDQPYSFFQFAGNKISNASIDYSFTRNNFHVSGEWAVDHSGNFSFVNSIMVALHNKADVVLLHRHYNKEYVSFQSNSFGDQSVPQNESGLYAGVTVRPDRSWQFDGYMDIIIFPWVKFNADAPSYSSGFSASVKYSPSRKAEWYVRYRNEMRRSNSSEPAGNFNTIISGYRSSVRTNLSVQLTRSWTLRQRLELIQSRNPDKWFVANGRMYYIETIYKPLSGRINYNFRVMLFDTDDFATRIYSYEQDVLFNASVPAVDGKGIRYYFNAHTKLRYGKKMPQWKTDVYVRFAQTIYSNKSTIGSGMDEINRNIKSEIKLQLILSSG